MFVLLNFEGFLFEIMSKRTRSFEDIDVHQPPKHSSRGLGQSKRVKRKTAAIVTDKENIPYSPQTEHRKLIAKPPIHPGIPQRTSSVKATNHPRPRALQPKVNNYSKLLATHPVSKHIAKSDLYNDEAWIGHQQQLFTSILNEILEHEHAHPDPWDEECIRKAAFDFYQEDHFQLIVRRLNNVSYFRVDHANL